jgi:glutaminyl-tRNA synthetase
MRVPFSRELWIEQDDFAEVPPPTCPPKSCRAGRRRKFSRLKPGGEVRLKYAYIIKCDEVIKDPTGKVVELRCTADLDSKTGGATSGRKIKGTIHWVSAAHAIDAECRLYDRLFTKAEPDAPSEVGTAGPAVRSGFMANINPHSLEVVIGKLEPSLREASPDARYQFERLGYFSLDLDTTPAKLISNRTITMKDAWMKIEKKQA